MGCCPGGILSIGDFFEVGILSRRILFRGNLSGAFVGGDFVKGEFCRRTEKYCNFSLSFRGYHCNLLVYISL